jgi:hypothetical protein
VSKKKWGVKKTRLGGFKNRWSKKQGGGSKKNKRGSKKQDGESKTQGSRITFIILYHPLIPHLILAVNNIMIVVYPCYTDIISISAVLKEFCPSIKLPG